MAQICPGCGTYVSETGMRNIGGVLYHAACAQIEDGYKPGAMERALRQRIDIMTREFAEERAEWNHDRENYIRDVSMMAEACGVQFDAPEAMADDIRRERQEAKEALERYKTALEEIASHTKPVSVTNGFFIQTAERPTLEAQIARAAISPPQGTE